MNHDLQCQLVRRVLAHVEARTTDADAGPVRLPIEAYADAARYEREHAALFRRGVVPIGHVSQLRAPGDFVTHDATGLPILVVRRDDGTLGAYLNVCRHRGTRLEPAPCGARKAFVCPYHAWSYDRGGALIGIPHEHGFAGLDRRDRGLVELPVAERAGLVVVRPTPGGAAIPADWLGPVAADLEGFGLAASHVFNPRATTRELNWKLAIDVFLESYHLRPTHRQSIYPMFFDNLGLVDRLGPHQRNVFPKRSIRELAAVPPADWALRRHANVLYHLFPSTLILVEPDHAAVLHLWPQGPARTLLTSYSLVPEAPATDKARAYWHANEAILYGAVDEDFTMGESIQRGLASGANRDVVFGAFEHALAHFHGQIEALASATLE